MAAPPPLRSASAIRGTDDSAAATSLPRRDIRHSGLRQISPAPTVTGPRTTAGRGGRLTSAASRRFSSRWDAGAGRAPPVSGRRARLVADEPVVDPLRHARPRAPARCPRAESTRDPDLIGGTMVRRDPRAAQRRRVPVGTRATCPPSRVDTVIVNQYRCVLAQSKRATPGEHWASRGPLAPGISYVSEPAGPRREEA
jgi:hypothetical protein